MSSVHEELNSMDSSSPSTKDFPWLEYDAVTGAVFCKPCVDAGYQCYFTLQGDTSILKEHESLEQHQAVVDGGYNFCQEDPDTDQEMKDLPGEQESPSDMSDENGEDSTKSQKETRVRKFCDHWLNKFLWLRYDKEKNMMFCKYCERHGNVYHSSNTFVKGTQTFRMTAIMCHSGSVDHQMAVNAEKLYNSSSIENDNKTEACISAKEKYFLRRYLSLYPWLIYRGDAQMMTCELCQRHTRNMLFVSVRQGMDFSVISKHSCLKLHIMAEQVETQSWSLAWEILSKEDGYKMDVCDDALKDYHKSDEADRSASIFRDVSVKVVGTEEELRASNSAINARASVENEKNTDPNKIKEAVESTKIYLSNKAIRNACSYSNTSIKKKPPILPAFGVFKKKWLSEFEWLDYDAHLNMMHCKICQKHKKRSSFASGVRVFSHSCIASHQSQKKHCDAVEAENAKNKKPGAVTKDDKAMPSKSQLPATNCAEPVMNLKTETEFFTGTADVPIKSEPMVDFSSSQDVPSSDTVPFPVSLYSSVPQNSPDLPHVSSSDPPAPQTNGSSPVKKRIRIFNPKWQNRFPWLQYNKEKNHMTCSWCVKFLNTHASSCAFTRGSRGFHIDSLRSHDGSIAHQRAALAMQEMFVSMAGNENAVLSPQ